MSFSKKLVLYFILFVSLLVVLGYTLFMCTYFLVNFSWQTFLWACLGLPLFLFFFNFLWREV